MSENEAPTPRVSADESNPPVEAPPLEAPPLESLPLAPTVTVAERSEAEAALERIPEPAAVSPSTASVQAATSEVTTTPPEASEVVAAFSVESVVEDGTRVDPPESVSPESLSPETFPPESLSPESLSVDKTRSDPLLSLRVDSSLPSAPAVDSPSPSDVDERLERLEAKPTTAPLPARGSAPEPETPADEGGADSLFARLSGLFTGATPDEEPDSTTPDEEPDSTTPDEKRNFATPESDIAQTDAGLETPAPAPSAEDSALDSTPVVSDASQGQAGDESALASAQDVQGSTSSLWRLFSARRSDDDQPPQSTEASEDSRSDPASEETSTEQVVSSDPTNETETETTAAGSPPTDEGEVAASPPTSEIEVSIAPSETSPIEVEAVPVLAPKQSLTDSLLGFFWPRPPGSETAEETDQVTELSPPPAEPETTEIPDGDEVVVITASAGLAEESDSAVGQSGSEALTPTESEPVLESETESLPKPEPAPEPASESRANPPRDPEPDPSQVPSLGATSEIDAVSLTESEAAIAETSDVSPSPKDEPASETVSSLWRLILPRRADDESGEEAESAPLALAPAAADDIEVLPGATTTIVASDATEPDVVAGAEPSVDEAIAAPPDLEPPLGELLAEIRSESSSPAELAPPIAADVATRMPEITEVVRSPQPLSPAPSQMPAPRHDPQLDERSIASLAAALDNLASEVGLDPSDGGSDSNQAARSTTEAARADRESTVAAVAESSEAEPGRAAAQGFDSDAPEAIPIHLEDPAITSEPIESEPSLVVAAEDDEERGVAQSTQSPAEPSAGFLSALSRMFSSRDDDPAPADSTAETTPEPAPPAVEATTVATVEALPEPAGANLVPGESEQQVSVLAVGDSSEIEPSIVVSSDDSLPPQGDHLESETALVTSDIEGGTSAEPGAGVGAAARSDPVALETSSEAERDQGASVFSWLFQGEKSDSEETASAPQSESPAVSAAPAAARAPAPSESASVDDVAELVPSTTTLVAATAAPAASIDVATESQPKESFETQSVVAVVEPEPEPPPLKTEDLIDEAISADSAAGFDDAVGAADSVAETSSEDEEKQSGGFLSRFFQGAATDGEETAPTPTAESSAAPAVSVGPEAPVPSESAPAAGVADGVDVPEVLPSPPIVIAAPGVPIAATIESDPGLSATESSTPFNVGIGTADSTAEPSSDGEETSANGEDKPSGGILSWIFRTEESDDGETAPTPQTESKPIAEVAEIAPKTTIAVLAPPVPVEAKSKQQTRPEPMPKAAAPSPTDKPADSEDAGEESPGLLNRLGGLFSFGKSDDGSVAKPEPDKPLTAFENQGRFQRTRPVVRNVEREDGERVVIPEGTLEPDQRVATDPGRPTHEQTDDEGNEPVGAPETLFHGGPTYDS